jgi:hypothetical protein
MIPLTMSSEKHFCLPWVVLYQEAAALDFQAERPDWHYRKPAFRADSAESYIWLLPGSFERPNDGLCLRLGVLLELKLFQTGHSKSELSLVDEATQIDEFPHRHFVDVVQVVLNHHIGIEV